MVNYHESKLWHNLKTKVSEKILGDFKTVIDSTIPLLKYIKTTFPNYTNHDSEHSLKIIKNIEMLLGDHVENLSEAESAVLLLAAYWHDLGMACSDIQKIKDERWFEKYQVDNNIENSSCLTMEVASDYLRQYHHERLEFHLYDTDELLVHLENDSLLIKEHNIIDIAYQVSKSHYENTENIIILEKYNSAERNDDFSFCAILLRLGDILDFDQERTETSTYKFLGLNSAITTSEKISQEEWKKHLSSLGFKYQNNILYFSATPTDPNIEHLIRKFIEVIDLEINKCSHFFNTYCKKWNCILKLPSSINVENIKSQGYKFGDFHFTLDHEKILNLLTGDNIYENQAVFIRELLQNSIDASLYIQAIKARNGIEYKCKPINVFDWYDDKGNYWIRFDDYGVGMDEYILLNYFTKIGVSFYESKDFDKTIGFKAISKFGIGILSCFMISNKIEVNTRKEGKEAIRFSINSLNSYFVTHLENEHKRVSYFPSPDDKKEKYRKDVGTSIAIQIDFNKLKSWINIEEELLENILCSPIEIQYKNKKIGTTLDILKDNFWIKHEETFELDKNDIDQINNFYQSSKKNNNIKITLQPIDISKNLVNPNIQGHSLQISISGLKCRKNEDYEFNIKNSKRIITLQLYKNRFNSSSSKEFTIELSKYPVIQTLLDKPLFNKISHNGIVVQKINVNSFLTPITVTHIYLFNQSRPLLDISRSKIRFNLETLLAMNLMFLQNDGLSHNLYNLKLVGIEGTKITYKEAIHNILPILSILQNTKLFNIITINGLQNVSIDEIIKTKLSNIIKIQIHECPVICAYDIIDLSYLHQEINTIITTTLLFLYTEVFFDISSDKKSPSCFISNITHHDETTLNLKLPRICQELFPVGFFIQYDNRLINLLQFNSITYPYESYSVNLKHPFSQWLISKAETLNKNFGGIFEDIKSVFTTLRKTNDEKKEQLIKVINVLQKIDRNIISKEVIESINFEIEQ
ncbi:HD domain-containing protein [Sulfurospirillum arsenophilum]|uniref:HD domain-containing protein n=1 Tax=Sulfurospirillum arsenophilum TaxID=56698 RepID=UPI0005A715AF|nr:ATP-binding protein [Sulfurospirillum arsenophilum]